MKLKYFIPILFFSSLIFISGCGVTGDFILISSSRTCFDSDDGRTYDVAGKVTLNTREYFDQCLSSDKITEHFCKDTHRKGVANAPCSIIGKAGCSAGECVDNPVTFLRENMDSDGGKNYEEFGFVTLIGGQEFMDFCLNKVTLREFYLLDSGKKAHINHICDNGCEDGTCILE